MGGHTELTPTRLATRSRSIDPATATSAKRVLEYDDSAEEA